MAHAWALMCLTVMAGSGKTFRRVSIDLNRLFAMMANGDRRTCSQPFYGPFDEDSSC